METTSTSPTKITSTQLKAIIYSFDFNQIALEDSDSDDDGSEFFYYKNDSHEFHSKDDAYMVSCLLYINSRDREATYVDNVKLYGVDDEIELTNEFKTLAENELKRHIQWM